jgi:2-keto-3-deoxy-galactonokinase
MSTQSPTPLPETGIRTDMPVPVPHSTSRSDGERAERHIPGVEATQVEKQDPSAAVEERANNLGCGLAFLIIGAGMLAQRLGWIPAGDWIWPAALIGLGVGYLYKAFRK